MKRFARLVLCVILTAWVMSFQLLPESAPQTQVQAKSGSTISYTLRHPLHTVNGISKQVNSQLAVSGTGCTPEQVKVSVPLTSFDSGNRARDRDMLHVTEASLYPEVTFTSTSITAANGVLSVVGLLTFHGVTREISFSARQEQQGEAVLFTGGFTISLEAYNIKRPSIMTIKVKDDLQVGFRMVYPARN